MNLGQLKICCQKILDKDKYNYTLIEKTKQTHSDIHYKKLKAAFYAEKLWPKNSVITIGFLNQPTNIIRTDYFNSDVYNKLDPLQYKFDKEETSIIDAIKIIVMERIQPIVNLKFKFLDDNPEKAKIRIDFNSGLGSWSAVGTDCLSIQFRNQATLNFGWFDVSTVMHEFGHVLGMIHEHQSPFDNQIQWNLPVLYKWAEETQGWNKEETNQQIVNKYDKTELNGSEFDPNSIMLYFYPPKVTLNNEGTKQNLTLSGLDVLLIYKSYPINQDINNLDIPTEFYKKIYNLDLQDTIKKSKTYTSTKIPYSYYIIIAILIFIVILFFILIFKK